MEYYNLACYLSDVEFPFCEWISPACTYPKPQTMVRLHYISYITNLDSPNMKLTEIFEIVKKPSKFDQPMISENRTKVPIIVEKGIFCTFDLNHWSKKKLKVLVCGIILICHFRSSGGTNYGDEFQRYIGYQFVNRLYQLFSMVQTFWYMLNETI